MKAMQRNYLFAIMIFFSMGITAAAQKINPKAIQLSKADVILFKNQETAYAQLQTDMQKLEQQKASLLLLMKQYDEKQKEVVIKIKKLEGVYDSINVQSTSQAQLLNATKQMQETQMSFNLQYLQLQSQMQHENRSYTAISNIMKTKHDTVKNSISNVR